MYHIIFNPMGGKGKTKEALKVVENILNDKQIEYQIHPTEYQGHATEITKELSKTENTKIIALGGDGSYNEILNGIDNFENITLGILPCGTGNDFVRASKHPTDIAQALDVILNGKTAYFDFIDVGHRKCLNIAGAGMDVDVTMKYDEMKYLKGASRYYASLIYTLLHLKFHKFRITIDDKTIEKSLFMIGVANGTCFGGGMNLSPNSKVNDGLLNVVMINELRKSKIPFELPKFLKGKHINKPYTEEYTCKKVTIQVLDEGRIQLDGEVIESRTLNCEVISNQLKLFV